MGKGNQTAKDTGHRGLELVLAELTRRGARVEVGDTRKNLLCAYFDNGIRQINIRTKAKGPNSLDWQVNLNDARSPEEPVDQNEYWILIDLSTREPVYYIVPGALFRRDIYLVHDVWLKLHHGTRPVTPDSKHHRVTMDRIEAYRDRWDLLGLSR